MRDLYNYSNSLYIMWMTIDLHPTIVTQEKSLFNVYDLFGDVGGLLDLLLIIIAIAFKPYNSMLFSFNSIQELFTLQQPETSFTRFIQQKLLSLCKQSEQSKIIDKCEAILDKELNLNEILHKLRQFEAMTKDESFFNVEQLKKFESLQ